MLFPVFTIQNTEDAATELAVEMLKHNIASLVKILHLEIYKEDVE